MTTCKTCQDEMWLCDGHPVDIQLPWSEKIEGGCTCGAGYPCPDCNESFGPDDPPKMPSGFEILADSTGDKRH